MSTSISTAFIKQFEAEVHMAYQRMGSKLRNTIRQVNNVKGSQARFQKVGTGSAVSKSRHAQIPTCLLYTSPSPRDLVISRMPSSA